MMDEISELEKYKDLLDSGAITEEEFTQLKQKLLGLKTDEEKEAERQAERAEALKEIDAMREAQKKKEEAAAQKMQEEAGQQNQEDTPKADQSQQTKSMAGSVGSVIKSIILWIVCIFLLFLAIPSLMMQNVFYVIFGIVALLLAILACHSGICIHVSCRIFCIIGSISKESGTLGDFNDGTIKMQKLWCF